MIRTARQRQLGLTLVRCQDVSGCSSRVNQANQDRDAESPQEFWFDFHRCYLSMSFMHDCLEKTPASKNKRSVIMNLHQHKRGLRNVPPKAFSFPVAKLCVLSDDENCCPFQCQASSETSKNKSAHDFTSHACHPTDVAASICRLLSNLPSRSFPCDRWASGIEEHYYYTLCHILHYCSFNENH